MTKEELDFIGAMNMCDEISNKAYQKIVNHFEETQPCEDCVSRTEVLNSMLKFIHHWVSECPSKELLADLEDRVNDLSYVTPTHGTCENCNNWDTSWQPNSANVHFCPMLTINTSPNYFCADWERKKE